MNVRFKLAHPLNKLFWLCLLTLVYFVFFVPFRSREKMKSKHIDFQSESDESEISNDIEYSYDIDEAIENESPPQYFVFNSKCKMPYVDPFAPEAREIFKPLPFETCSNESDLVTPVFDMNRQRYVLHINESLAAHLLKSKDADYYCFYTEVTRDSSDDSYKMASPQIYFSQDYVVPLHVEAMIVLCHRMSNESDVLQHDAFSLVQPIGRPRATPRRKPSVLMFGIDSTSRINLRRTMPKVYKYLTRWGWYEMQGYNKVADNTFPNLMAVLSGYTPDTAKEQVCDTDDRECLNNFPFIWKYLKNASYLTAYAEDIAGMNTFNYLKPGFKDPPTDYYLRPLLTAIESKMESKKCADCTLDYCVGRRLTSSYVYDFCRQFAQRYINEQPIWGLFWSNSFSHDDFALPSKMEQKILQYLLDFESDGVFEESIFIFFADHGTRFGSLSCLTSGFLDERWPMLFIYLPPWFRRQYPQYAKALALNRNRLSSNYDLHNTLKHIIEIGGTPDGRELPKAYDCPKCHSLFYPLSEQRNCADAGILEHWCTCEPYKRIEGKWGTRLAPLVIDRMNEYLAGKNLSTLCSSLSLSYVHRIEIKYGLDIDWHNEMPRLDVANYRIKFKVQQNSADFMATFVFNNITENIDLNVETISRTNSYEEDSTCLEDKIAKLYCICKSDLRP
ncbi:uncharacterized protein LOC115626357 [Scaptodrosophila lebanonensis]|uniref:Uncharacterized protein LOC115626357 n=1 Tax=Drosophila lebanonensis TaxID=7225 RepID=A0A6J2TR26_DROLE|nr:uncharacterized protein LOC115626357 [Scaptodrosophila lebanonensis]